MSNSQLNPAQHVNRIREIIMGRDLTQVHGRLECIENDVGDGSLTPASAPSSTEISELKSAYHDLQEECHRLRMELHQEKFMRKQQLSQIDQHLGQMAQQPATASGAPALPPAQTVNTDELASQMAARIDGRFREILSHLQTELLQWKGQLDRDVQSIHEVKADRRELSLRFAKMAAAAMEDENKSNPEEDYLL